MCQFGVDALKLQAIITHYVPNIVKWTKHIQEVTKHPHNIQAKTSANTRSFELNRLTVFALITLFRPMAYYGVYFGLLACDWMYSNYECLKNCIISMLKSERRIDPLSNRFFLKKYCCIETFNHVFETGVQNSLWRLQFFMRATELFSFELWTEKTKNEIMYFTLWKLVVNAIRNYSKNSIEKKRTNQAINRLNTFHRIIS